MKFVTADLHHALAALAAFIPKKPISPILGHVLMNIETALPYAEFVVLSSRILAVATIPIPPPPPTLHRRLLIPSRQGELDMLIKALKAHKQPQVEMLFGMHGAFSVTALPSTELKADTDCQPAGFPSYLSMAHAPSPTPQLGIPAEDFATLGKAAKAFDSTASYTMTPGAPTECILQATWGGVLKILLMPTNPTQAV